jgi:hypothetical protein
MLPNGNLAPIQMQVVNLSEGATIVPYTQSSSSFEDSNGNPLIDSLSWNVDLDPKTPGSTLFHTQDGQQVGFLFVRVLISSFFL